MALVRGLVDLLYPPACQICRSPGVYPLCRRCVDSFALIKQPFCQQCGKPLRGPSDLVFTCIPCRHRRWYFSCARAAGVYDGPLREAIHALKFGGRTVLAEPLGGMLADVVAGDPRLRPDVIVPVPLHTARLRERGFNQSVLLAQEAGRRLSIPVEADRLQRTRSTAPQTGLAAKERRRNVQAAFRVAGPLHARQALLIDDVMSTGSTTRECAKALRQAGASEVVVGIVGIAVFR